MAFTRLTTTTRRKLTSARLRKRRNKADEDNASLPAPPAECHVPERVEHRFAGGPAAQHRLVLHRRQVGALLQRGEEAGEGHHHARGLQPAGGPDVPAEAHAIALLVLLDELQVGRHGAAAALEGTKQSTFRQVG